MTRPKLRLVSSSSSMDATLAKLELPPRVFQASVRATKAASELEAKITQMDCRGCMPLEIVATMLEGWAFDGTTADQCRRTLQAASILWELAQAYKLEEAAAGWSTELERQRTAAERTLCAFCEAPAFEEHRPGCSVRDASDRFDAARTRALEGHLERRHGVNASPEASPIIGARHGRRSVPGKRLDGGQVGPSVEKIADVRSPKVVRAKRRDAGDGGERA